MTPIIEMDRVSFGYTPGNDLLKGLTFQVEQGAFVGIAGPNGSGKTTLLRLLTGLLRPQAGLIRIQGMAVDSYKASALAEKVAVVGQESGVPLGFSAAETVLMARVARMGHRVFNDSKDLEVTQESLRLMDAALLADRPLSRLSGGERQRVLIARALAQDTPILLLDEPTTFLDLRHQLEVYDLLKAVQGSRNKTILIITHDLNLAYRYCDRVLMLFGPSSSDRTERFLFAGPGEVLTPSRIEQVFGVQVLSGRIGDQQVFVPIKERQGKRGGG
jgi:iron complex transport system ATP-binding protein